MENEVIAPETELVESAESNGDITVEETEPVEPEPLIADEPTE